jgi:hypothetical protein
MKPLLLAIWIAAMPLSVGPVRGQSPAGTAVAPAFDAASVKAAYPSGDYRAVLGTAVQGEIS